MAVYDFDGSSSREIAAVYDFDGSSSREIAAVYDFDGSSSHLIWDSGSMPPGPSPSEDTKTIEVSGLQNNTWHKKSIQVGNYRTVTVLNFVPAQSYGSASTYLAVYRNGWPECVMRDMTRTYTGAGFSDTMNQSPQDVYQGLQPGDTIELSIKASYDPNVSGQGTSTATAKIKLSK